MITDKGKVEGLQGLNIFKITRGNGYLNFFGNSINVVDSGNFSLAKNILTSQKSCKWFQKGVTDLSEKFLNSLSEGDIVSVLENGVVNVLWQCNSDENLLFLTDYCNSHCIMCPQTQLPNIAHYYQQAICILELVKDTPKYLCLSGGEPTFLKNEYLTVLSMIKNKFPNIALQILTNGKNFADFTFAKNSVLTSPVDTLYAIPIYSGNPELHDEIVCSKGSFNKAIYGILNLYRLQQNIEIRIVITKKNYRDLSNIAHFIYWNMPFVFRIAFMGMETHGAASDNLKEVWIEPVEYMKYLQEAVLFLNDRMLNVSIYNLPHCLLSNELKNFAQDSISEWKKSFLYVCKNCSKASICSGVFSTSINIPKGIHSI